MSRQGWATASAYVSRRQVPYGEPGDLAYEVAWRVIMLVEAQKDVAETAMVRSLVQAILSGPGSNEGFQASSRAYRTYTESRTPWLEKERVALENELRRRGAEWSKYVVSISPLEDH